MVKKLNFNKDAILDFVKRYALISLGCVLYSLGVALFLESSKLSSGGATGVAIIISHLSGIDMTWMWILVLNVPLLILGAIYFGLRFTVSTLYTIGLSSLLMWLWGVIFGPILPIVGGPMLPLPEGHEMFKILIDAVVGGVLFALGMGLIFRMGSSSGGTDIPVKILRKKFRHIQTGIIAMISDIIIVSASFLAFQDVEKLFFTVLSVVVFTLVFDWVLYGGNSAKMIFVISENEPAQRICRRVLTEVDTGATFVDAEGAYTSEQKRILLCVVKPYMLPKLRDIVHEEDGKAFMIVSSAKEIYGLGYQDAGKDQV